MEIFRALIKEVFREWRKKNKNVTRDRLFDFGRVTMILIVVHAEKNIYDVTWKGKKFPSCKTMGKLSVSLGRPRASWHLWPPITEMMMYITVGLGGDNNVFSARLRQTMSESAVR